MELNKMWKWAAMNINGYWWLYTKRPKFNTKTGDWYVINGNALCLNHNLFDTIPNSAGLAAGHSLQSICDGRWLLVGNIPEKDTPVVVSNDEREEIAYSAGELDGPGFLVCYSNGRTSLTQCGTESWPMWEKLATKEGC